MRSKVSLIVALVAVVLALLTASRMRPKPKPIITQNILQQETGVPVEVVPIRIADVNDALNVTGQLAADSVTVLSTKISGKVQTVAARAGESVSEGQIVIQLDDSDARREMEQAEAGVRQARAALESAESRLSQARTGARVGSVQSSSGVEQARAALASARARLEQVTTGARRQERQVAQNAVSVAKANMDKAQSDYNRYKGLYDDGAVSAATLEAYSTQLSIARSQHNSAVESLNLIQEGGRTEEVRQAEAAVQQAQQSLRSALAEKERDANRDEDVRAAMAGVSTARAGVEAARASLGIARQKVENHRIRAPRSGSVTARDAEPGQYVNPGVPLLTIVDLGTIYLQADVPETSIGRVKASQLVDIRVDALPNRMWRGRVQSIIASADPAARSFTTRIAVANSDRSLRPNMYARASIITGTLSDAMLVPKQAVIKKDNRTTVVRVVNGKADLVSVTTGLTTDNEIVVRSPVLQPSDQIVVSGQQQLQKGQDVDVA